MSKTTILLSTLLLFVGIQSAYADEAQNQEYNYNKCFNDKFQQCLTTNCPNSEKLDCSQTCRAGAKSECESKGVTQPTP